VVAIPRGSLPMGEVLANGLHLPLDIVLTKKIGAPFNPELAIGAVSLDSYSLHPFHAQFSTPEYITNEVARIQQLLCDRYKKYKGSHSNIRPFHNKRVILVDDGIATGRTFIETMKFIRKQEPLEIIAAVPVIPADTLLLIEEHADKVIYLMAPENFMAVGQFYREFPQVSDEEAIEILNRANK